MGRLSAIMEVVAPSRMERRAKAAETLARADALRKMTDLAQQEYIAKRNAFKASETNRLNSHWRSWTGDINTILRSELRTLRNRSRWLTYNNPHAQSALSTLINYVIGTGMMPQPTVRQIIQTTVNGRKRNEAVEMDNWNDYMEDLFSLWADNMDMNCTESDPGTFQAQQAMVLRRWFEDGECFIRTRAVKSWDVVPFASEILLPEWLDESITSYNGHDVCMGIEIDKFGRKLAYHFISADGDGTLTASRKTVRVPASDMIHVYVRHQPRQLRGVPPMTAPMERFFHLDEYSDYELIGAKIAACFGAFITTPPGDAGDVTTLGNQTQVTDADGNVVTTVEPGIIAKLPPGYGVSFAQPQKPGATYGMFTEDHKRSIAAGIEFGLSYEAMTRDTSKSSFAGGRLSQLMDFQTFRSMQTFIGSQYVKTMYRRCLDAAVASGAVEAPGYFLPAPGKHFWRRMEILTSGWPWGINPLQEVNASRESMKAGITTLADECSYLGRSWKQQVRLKHKIDEECRRLNVTLSSDAATGEIDQTQNVPDAVDEEVPSEQPTGKS
jgi:lambda family phage portal protein